MRQNLFDAKNLRTMGVTFPLAHSMVLAVHSHPFPSDHAGSQPQPESKEMTHDRVQFEGAVSLAAMQVDGDSRNSDVGENQGGKQVSAEVEIQQSVYHFVIRVGGNGVEL